MLDLDNTLVDRLRRELLEHIHVYPGVIQALETLVETGAALVVVTNGTVDQQRRKLHRTGLLHYSPHPVISEAVGAKKPHRVLFDTALSQAGYRPEQSWMVGDHPVTDMAGAHQLGIRTGWVSHHRLWPHPWAPDAAGAMTADVLQHIVAAAGHRR